MKPSGLFRATASPAGRRGGNWRAFRGRHAGGPSPAECLLPQMQDRERRKRYRNHDVAQAPSKLIGYVSAGSVECPREPQPPKRQTGGRRVVAGLVLLLTLLWLGFGGADALFGPIFLQ